MSAIVSPAHVSPALSSTASPARARNADEPQGRSFHAALDRSRASQADAEADADSASQRPGTPRRGAPGAKDEAAPEIPNLDFFVPAVSVPVTAAAARAGAEAVTAAALRAAATATERTDAQAASTTTDAAVEAATGAAALDSAAIDAAAEGARADGKPADAMAADTLRAAAGKASTTAAQADAAAATAKADAALPATPAATPLLNAAMASTVPTPSTPTARAGRADVAGRDTAAPTVNGTIATAEATEADPLDLLAARIETTAGSDAGVADDSTPNAPLAWMAAQPGNAGNASGTAATDGRTPVLTLAPPLDSDAWAPALGQQMLRMSASGMHTAQLSINPENLGPLQITLKLGEDQAQAMFVSAHESVRKAVEAALPQLRTTLAEHGISLGQTAVGEDTRQPGGQSGFAGDNPSGRSSGNGGNAYAGAARSGAVAANAVAAAPVRRAPAEGAVDTFA